MRSRRTRCGNGIAGFGATPAEALRDLAQKIESYRFELPEVEGDQRRPQLKIVKRPLRKNNWEQMPGSGGGRLRQVRWCEH